MSFAGDRLADVQDIALVCVAISMFWLLFAAFFRFYGRAARYGLNLSDFMPRPNPKMNQQGIERQRTLGRVGDTMVRLWPVPVVFLAVAIVLFAVGP